MGLHNKMFNFVKKVVAGPKKMIEYEGHHLDLTYISERIIAMAFPVCTILQKLYRNNIKDVVEYLNAQHKGNYLVLNVSNRLYDYSNFQEKVKDFEWADHQAPTLTTLVHIGFSMYHFLSSQSEGVVAIHCNHGKGRTGTAIIGFLVLIRYMNSVQECLKLYNSKRFSSENYGVSQPCQLRYLKFVSQLTKEDKIDPKLRFYRLKKAFQTGLSRQCFLKITRTRDQKAVLDVVPLNGTINGSMGSNMLFSDIFIEIYRESKIKQRRKVARYNFHLYFLNKETLELKFTSKDIKVEKDNLEDFQVTIQFQFFCLCHLTQYEGSKCSCTITRVAEEMFWGQMVAEINECKRLSVWERRHLVHGTSLTQTLVNDIEEEQKFQIIINEPILKTRKLSTPDYIMKRSPRKDKIYAQLLNVRKTSMKLARPIEALQIEKESDSEEQMGSGDSYNPLSTLDSDSKLQS